MLMSPCLLTTVLFTWVRYSRERRNPLQRRRNPSMASGLPLDDGSLMGRSFEHYRC